MGLSICVGLLADLREEDVEGYEHLKEQLALANLVLARAGRSPHVEPEAAEPWSAEMFGYAGLHYLRRVAAHLKLRGALPAPGDEHVASDAVIQEYGDLAMGVRRGLKRLLGKGKPRRQRFDHLLLHSDAEGFYLPVDFDEVLHAADGVALAGGMLGSSQQLLRECLALRDALGIPEELDPDADHLWDVVERQGQGSGWERYGVEAFSCVRLLHGAKLSVERGAALVFT